MNTVSIHIFQWTVILFLVTSLTFVEGGYFRTLLFTRAKVRSLDPRIVKPGETQAWL